MVTTSPWFLPILVAIIGAVASLIAVWVTRTTSRDEAELQVHADMAITGLTTLVAALQKEGGDASQERDEWREKYYDCRHSLLEKEREINRGSD